MKRNVTVEGFKHIMQEDLKERLTQIEELKERLMVADSENGAIWEDRVLTEARAKLKGALLLAEEGLKKLEPAAPATTTRSHATSVAAKSGTKREPVSLPKFAGSEKPGNSPFLDFPVWLMNWQQHIIDYEDKSRSNLLLSHLDKENRRYGERLQWSDEEARGILWRQDKGY